MVSSLWNGLRHLVINIIRGHNIPTYCPCDQPSSILSCLQIPFNPCKANRSGFLAEQHVITFEYLVNGFHTTSVENGPDIEAAGQEQTVRVSAVNRPEMHPFCQLGQQVIAGQDQLCRQFTSHRIVPEMFAAAYDKGPVLRQAMEQTVLFGNPCPGRVPIEYALPSVFKKFLSFSQPALYIGDNVC